MATTPVHPEPSEPDPALLPLDPPGRAARWTAWLLLAIAVAAVAFVGLVKLPEVISASFVLESAQGEDPVQAPLAGELAAVRASEGQQVKAGEELFTLRSDDIRNWQARLRQLQEDQRALTERVAKRDEAHAAQLAIKDAELVQADREASFRQRYLDTTKDFVRRAQNLATAGLLSEVELMRHRLEVAQAEKDLVLGEKARQQVLLQRQQLVTLRAQERTEERAEDRKLVVQLETLTRQLENCSGDLKSVRAPYDAIVVAVRQRNPGSMVTVGAELCQLARRDARLRARLTLSESSVPRLRPGLRLRLRFEAYPYQRYGSVPAVVEQVSPAAVVGPNGAAFQALCTLDAASTQALVRPKAGMRGEARVVVGRRTLLRKALEPLLMLRERAARG